MAFHTENTNENSRYVSIFMHKNNHIKAAYFLIRKHSYSQYIYTKSSVKSYVKELGLNSQIKQEQNKKMEETEKKKESQTD